MWEARHAKSVTEVSGRLEWSTPKTYAPRSVPFPASLVDPIRSACREKKADDLVFGAPDGGVLRLRNWRSRVFDPACQRAVLADVTPHDLRHTAASLAIASGASVKAVQRMLGQRRPR